MTAKNAWAVRSSPPLSLDFSPEKGLREVDPQGIRRMTILNQISVDHAVIADLSIIIFGIAFMVALGLHYWKPSRFMKRAVICATVSFFFAHVLVLAFSGFDAITVMMLFILPYIAYRFRVLLRAPENSQF
jgi:hypothetical protein